MAVSTNGSDWRDGVTAEQVAALRRSEEAELMGFTREHLSPTQLEGRFPCVPISSLPRGD